MEGVKPNKTCKLRSGWKQNTKGQPIAVLVLVEGSGTPRQCWDFDPQAGTFKWATIAGIKRGSGFEYEAYLDDVEHETQVQMDYEAKIHTAAERKVGVTAKANADSRIAIESQYRCVDLV